MPAKPKVVKPKVTKVERKKRLSKGAEHPWEVRFIGCDDSDGFQDEIEECYTREEAEDFIKYDPNLLAPVIVHVDIPPIEY